MKDVTPYKMEELWEEDLLERYPVEGSSTKSKADFRNYNDPKKEIVKEFYRVNHLNQTYEFVLRKEKEFLSFNRKEMTLWEAVEFLNTLVDDSDPDTDLDQTQHLLQTSEAIRADGQPDWFVLTGFLHDLGKVLCLFGEPQWCVVGDTFPVGCEYSDKIVYPEFFQSNPDRKDSRFNTKFGVYEPNCGLDKVHLSWGHDEYIYQIMKDFLPEEGLAMLRYHSFYSQHRENAYGHLMNKDDRKLFESVKKFNLYDLYSKAAVPPDVKKLRPYYEDLAAKFLPGTLKF
jgi:inositol oxygenase